MSETRWVDTWTKTRAGSEMWDQVPADFARRLEALVHQQQEALDLMRDIYRDRCPACKGEALKCVAMCARLEGRCGAMKADEALAAYAALAREMEKRE